MPVVSEKKYDIIVVGADHASATKASADACLNQDLEL